MIMDREQEELQFLGFFGILKESLKIIFSWKKIFTQITLCFICPLSFIFLAHFIISQLIFARIINNQDELSYTRAGTRGYDRLSSVISTEWITFWLFKAAYFTFLLILSLLSTSAVVYTIACIYTGKEISFKKVLSVVPKVWKRLLVTFLWSFVIAFVYDIVSGVILVLPVAILGFGPLGISVFVLLLVPYLIGLVYISLIWQLASVVSVLEDDYGIKAMKKSKALIKGKMGVSVAVFLLLVVCFVGIQVVFEIGVLFIWSMMVVIPILCFLMLFVVMLFGLVAQTVIYFVCKSYHHENIDKSSLADHLEVYLGEYVPLKAKDVQLEQFHV